MARVPIEFHVPAVRRRFFIDAVRRRASRGSGSDLEALMRLPGRLHEVHRIDMLEELFVGIRVVLVGAHAAAAYAPERMTQAVDFLTHSQDYVAACSQLLHNGYKKERDLSFATTRLGLYGSSWSSGTSNPGLDLISSEQPWVEAAFCEPSSKNRSGDRVIPLAYLVLMKLDAARSIDQGDLSRALGRLAPDEVERVVEIVAKHYPSDVAAIEDVREYAEFGRREYKSGKPLSTR